MCGVHAVLQDVGLIFLSAMATSIVEIGQEVGLKEAEVVGTAMLTLTVATTLVGILTYLVGGCRDTPRHTRLSSAGMMAAALCWLRKDAAVF